MSKYAPLTHHLETQRASEAPMSFAEIERVLGFPLPASKQYAAWWSNNPSNNVMTRAWLKAGFKTERVDVSGERVVFRRTEHQPQPPAPSTQARGFYDRARARAAGTVWIAPDADVFSTGEVWDAER